MKFTFDNKKISGILTVVPQNELRFEDEIENYNFSTKQSMKLKLVMGYDKRRIAHKGVCSSDLCEFGMNYLFNNNLLNKDEVDALIMVTQSPDYFMPATSNILHGKLGLKKDIFCIDICQGCCGFLIGLIQAFMLLEQKNINKVVLDWWNFSCHFLCDFDDSGHHGCVNARTLCSRICGRNYERKCCIRRNAVAARI